MTKIILESNYSNHQKIVLVLLFIVTFFIGSLYWLMLILGLVKFSDFYILDYVFVLFFPLSFLAFLHLFSKNGIIINGKELLQAKFIFGKPWFKKSVNLEGLSDIAILNSDKVAKFMFAAAASPDQGYSLSLKEVYLLNENHTRKELLFTTKNQGIAEKTIEILNENFAFSFNKYNPRFPNRRIVRRR